MKKYLPLIAALSLMASIPAAAQDENAVYSNVVGMTKVSLPTNGFEMITINYDEDAQNDNTLGGVFSDLSNESVIFLWIDNSYVKYTYFVSTGSWYDNEFNLSDSVIIEKGSSLWLKDGGSGSNPMQTGVVPEEGSFEVSFGLGFSMIGNPYPVSTPLSEFTSPDLANEDVLFVWDGENYTKYTYFTSTGSWYDNTFELADSIEISAGKGVWLKSSTSGSITFTKSY